ncbi:MAG: ectonucleotide pyrophosphatase/phosphodiesterase [Sphingomonadaceae bacterium]
MRTFRQALLASLALLAVGCTPVPPAATALPPAAPAEQTAAATPVILLSIDGFRADYLDRGLTPNLQQLAKTGAHAPYMRPGFPSVTFPNHYSVVTGKAPGEHGIINNTIEDPEIPGVTFRLSNAEAVTDRRWWDDAEPIWVTAEKRGIRTATMFWPGSEAAIRGVRPTDFTKFDRHKTSTERIDQVLAWLDRPEAERPRLITLYLQETDDIGHAKGTEGPEIDAAIRNSDAAVGRLLEGLRARNLAANLVVVSDHGMVNVNRVIRLDKIASPQDFRLVTGGAVAGIEAREGREAALAASLLKPHDGMECWKKGTLPARFVYNDHRRIPSFICLATPGGMITDREPQSLPAGMHGYDPDLPEMAAIFVANGPDIPAGTDTGPMRVEQVQPYLLKLLGLTR